MMYHRWCDFVPQYVGCGFPVSSIPGPGCIGVNSDWGTLGWTSPMFSFRVSKWGAKDIWQWLSKNVSFFIYQVALVNGKD